MVVRSEKNRIKALVTDTITLLCKNGLQTSSGFSIEGVIGITSLDDEDDVFIIPIKEIIKNMPEKASSESESESPSSACKRKRKRRRKSSQLDSENIPHEQSISPDPHLLKHEIESDSNSNDVVMVKEEPSTPRLYSNISLHTEQNTQMNNIGDVSHSHLYGSSQMFTPSPSSQWSSSNNAHLFATMPHPPPRTVNPQNEDDQTAEVELIPNSGVFVKRHTYMECRLLTKGSKVVRKLVKDLFPDIHVLANSSCIGGKAGPNPNSSASGLDPKKIDAIKTYCSSLPAPVGPIEIGVVLQAINQCIRDARHALRKRGEIPPAPPRLPAFQLFSSAQTNDGTTDSMEKDCM